MASSYSSLDKIMNGNYGSSSRPTKKVLFIGVDKDFLDLNEDEKEIQKKQIMSCVDADDVVFLVGLKGIQLLEQNKKTGAVIGG